MDQLQVITTLPQPKLKARTVVPKLEQAAIQLGINPVLARVIAARPIQEDTDLENFLDPKLTCITHPLQMQDMQKACQRVADAILNKEVIGIETDHDCDGQTSHAVLHYNLVQKFQHPQHLVRSYIGHRLTEGYGLSSKVMQRILTDDPRPSLVITADNGSADEDRIQKLAAQGIDVIVTDHHQLPIAGSPASAFACLNPTREDCQYGDPYIAGCMVAWLLMAATRAELITRAYLPQDFPKLSDSLDYVAVGTVADCVSMARSLTNRAIVKHGLKLINAGIKPCWVAVKSLSQTPLTAEDLGFKVGPLLNSDGRLSSAFGSVAFLLAENFDTAQEGLRYLKDQNLARRGIQNSITQQGLQIAAQQANSGRFSLCIFLREGHAGVHGISASRIKDSFGRPTVFLAPKQGEENLLTGSIRGISGFHVGDAIKWLIQHNPGLLIAGGGHGGAGGVTLKHEHYQKFETQFEVAARQQLNVQDLGPVIWTDGVIPSDLLKREGLYLLDLLAAISQLEPFGREFEAPVFELHGTLENLRVIGDGTHARVEIVTDHQIFNGVWFTFRHAPEHEWPVQIGQQIHCAYMLRANDFGGQRRCEIQVVWLHGILE